MKRNNFMPVHNADVADVLSRLADLLEIEDANQFRVRAYRNAARTIGDLSRPVADMVEQGEDLTDLPGIGDSMVDKIEEIVSTGTLKQLEETESQTPAGLSELMNIQGLGPKRAAALHKQLGVENQEDLKKAAENQKIREISGFGPKTEQKILKDLQREQRDYQRHLLSDAEQLAAPLADYLRAVDGVKELVVAGSYRRRKETVGDLDILVTAKKDSPVMDAFVDYEDVAEVVSQGSTRSTVLLKRGLQVDLRLLPQVSYGAALHYFTGSKAHNIAVRKRGLERDYKINEYGVFKGDDRVAGRTEQEVYAAVDLPFIPPEIREDRGEIQAAEQGRLPRLVTVDDIRGDLHAHTKETDGSHSLEQMAQAAQKRGYQYLAISDHSKKVTVASGLNARRLAKQIDAIDELNDRLDGLTLLKSMEVDILEDGDLDLENDMLERLDVVTGSVHYQLGMPKNKMTRRVLAALDHPHINILGHPTGRLLHERDAFELDLEAVIERAVENGVFLELNAHPDRLDLNDVHCKMAKDMGAKIAICTDAHKQSDLDLIRFGIGQARRGWIEADDVINTRSLKDLRKLLRR
jgi:DNA polymerase (family 10)